MSYNGRINFGLLGDYDAMPDIDDLGQDIEESLGELLKAAKRRRPRKRAASPNGRGAGARTPA